ncbi:metallophosphoesterase [Gaetbulibacter jejuensis]|uniref:Calcineurin-like phosphoesterase domain-containing protein n=1 Tax=Gaetbulibacter jejuensis TaxID=584607 RepID=A0ABP3UVD3_9FLAO
MLKIIHLSDLHIDNSSFDLNHKNLINALIKDLKKYVDKDTLMIFSGDFLNQGGRNFPEEMNPYEIVDNFLNKLTDSFPMLKDRVFFVPGNHEVKRSSLQEYVDFPFKENLLKSKSNLNGFLNDLYNKDTYIINGLKGYNEFSKGYFSNYPKKQLSDLDNTFIIEGENSKIGVSCLNSSWLCYDDNDDGNIAIGIKQIEHSLSFIDEVDLKICVVHHPLNYLSKNVEQSEIEKKIQNEFDIVLIGHTHEQKTDYISGINGDYFISVGKSLTAENSEIEVYKNGYSIVEYLVGDNVTCHFRKYDDDKKIFISNTDNALNDGKLVLQIQKREVLSTSQEQAKIMISNSFNSYLTDAGAKFTNRSSKDIKLNDIYVEPFLERFDVVDNEENNNTLTTSFLIGKTQDSTFKNIIVFGEENSGKTTLCKVMYRELFDEGSFIPIYIKGEDLKDSSVSKLEKLISKQIEKQYANYSSDCKKKIYLIIDDFKNSKLQFKYKKALINNILESDYNTLIIWDEYLTLNEFLDVKNIDIDIFEILQFGSKKRFELIKKWSDLVNEDEYIDEKDKVNNYYQVEKIIDSIIGKNLVPSFPIYILIVLQSNELTTTASLEQSTFGYYYDVLIKSAIGDKVKKNKEIEKMYSYLSELSYWLFKKRILKITEQELMEFHLNFNSLYDIDVSFKEYNSILLETQILSLTIDGLYKFKYTYIYFYFIGKYLSDNIEDEDVRVDIKILSQKLYQSHAANIYLFLSHHSKSKYIIDMVVDNSNTIFTNAKVMNFNTDVGDINNLIEQTSEGLSLETSKTYSENKEEELDMKDGVNETSREEDIVIDEEVSANIDFISQVNISYKSIEILGHILKNRYASLRGEDKNAIVEQIYFLSIKTLSSIFEILLQGEEHLRKEILELINQDTSITENEKDLLAKMIMFNMLYMVSYSVIKKVSISISSKDLKLTFNQVENDNKDNNIIRLISIANKLDYSTYFPLEDVKLLKEDFNKNKLPYFILRRLGFNFLRLKPINEIEQQKIAETLEISMKKQRSIDVTSKTK